MTQPLHLRALEEFKAGERGYATDAGVRHVTGPIPHDAIIVMALEHVPAGQHGDFQESPRLE